MTGPTAPLGRLYAVRVEDGACSEIFPYGATSALNAERFVEQADLNPLNFRPHGIDVAFRSDGRTEFLTAAQVSALVAATSWPYNVLVNVAAWSGLRAAELGGLQIQDIESSPNGGMKIHVERTAAAHGLTKTDGSMRTVPVPGPTASLIRDYLAEHPRADEPTAPLWPGVSRTRPRATGVRATPAAPGAANTDVEGAQPSATAKDRARRGAHKRASCSTKTSWSNWSR